jgi:hypothetical protein
MQTSAERERHLDAPTKHELKSQVVSTVASGPEIPDGLDWQTFSAAYFPGRRRHDLEALSAYGAYRRSETIHEQSPNKRAPTEDADTGSRALQNWEDKGGGPVWDAADVDTWGARHGRFRPRRPSAPGVTTCYVPLAAETRNRET